MSETREKTMEGQKENTSFPFIGEALALDLVNTEILVRGKKHEFLTSSADAMRWWQEATLQHSDRARVKGEEETTQWDDTLLTNLKRLRTVLRHLFNASIERHSANASELEEFNRVLALGHQSLEMDAAGKTTALYETTEPEYGAVLVPIAQSALYILIEAERVRLRKCANERCIGLFYDTTRSATRHWCSPECMNRARSLQHYREAKARKALSSSH